MSHTMGPLMDTIENFRRFRESGTDKSVLDIRFVDKNGDEVHQAWERATKEYREYWRMERRMLLEQGVDLRVIHKRIACYKRLRLRFYTLWLPAMCIKVQV